MKKNTCKYERSYYDYEEKKFLMFRCEEEAVKDGFCVFHHPEYWKEHSKEVAEKFYEKVELAIKSKRKLLCIGYNLPYIAWNKELPIPTYFNGATFTKEADFSWATFTKEAYFSWATFTKEAYFIALERMEGNIQKDDPVLIFQNVTLNTPEKVRFDDFDLSNTSFAYTDVTKIDIGERTQWKTNKKPMDERLADEGEIPYENAATVYRRLRQNLESKLRYTEAGRFFIAEMECKRKNIKTKNRLSKWLRTNVFSALAWYKYFSNYGESYKRLIPWIIGTPVAAAFLTTLFTTPLDLNQLATTLQKPYTIIQQITTTLSSPFATNFKTHLKDYLFAFLQLKTDNTPQLLTRILSLLLMGQLYIALRRQFERRYKTTQ